MKRIIPDAMEEHDIMFSHSPLRTTSHRSVRSISRNALAKASNLALSSPTKFSLQVVNMSKLIGTAFSQSCFICFTLLTVRPKATPTSTYSGPIFLARFINTLSFRGAEKNICCHNQHLMLHMRKAFHYHIRLSTLQ